MLVELTDAERQALRVYLGDPGEYDQYAFTTGMEKLRVALRQPTDPAGLTITGGFYPPRYRTPVGQTTAEDG